MPGPVSRVHALSLGHATTLRARKACTHTYIASRSQTRRSAPVPLSVSPSHAGVLRPCCCIMRQRLCAARTRRRARPRRASGSVGNFSGQPVRLQPDVARHARAPAPLGSRREVSRERPTVLKQDATVVISLVYGVCGISTCTCRNSYMYEVLEYM